MLRGLTARDPSSGIASHVPPGYPAIVALIQACELDWLKPVGPIVHLWRALACRGLLAGSNIGSFDSGQQFGRVHGGPPPHDF